MLVSEVIDFALISELKQLPVAKMKSGDPSYEQNQLDLIKFINLGMIDIYKRFALKRVKQIVATVVDGTAVTMGDDYLYLAYACGTNEDETEIPIQNEFATFSVFEYSPYEISFERDDDLNPEIVGVTLTYIAAPALLTAVTQPVLLKYQYIEPLILYMAYKAHSGITAKQDEDNNVYFQRYIASINRIVREGNQTPDNQSNYKLFYKGFC